MQFTLHPFLPKHEARFVHLYIRLFPRIESELFLLIGLCFFLLMQHPFIKDAKSVSILRDLIIEAMEIKAKRHQEQQRELEDDDDNSVSVPTK